MPYLFLSLLFAAALPVRSAPSATDCAALAKKYAPQWRFHSSETYFPSSIEFFLSNVDLVDASNNTVQADPTVQTLNDPADQGLGLYLATDIDANKAGWLQGQNPMTTPSSVYTFAAPKDNGVVDLYYWLFTPFNAGKDVSPVGRVGDHVGDWERMTVRTVNGVATQVEYHAHSDTASVVPWNLAPKFDSGKRPVGYIAAGSHGIWQDAGTHTYFSAVLAGQTIELNDLTDDGGVQWDTKNSVVTLSFPGTFSGNLDWLNYAGDWGNQGETDCYWYSIYPECEVVTGPPGPYRPNEMSGPLSQVLGTPASSNTSSFTIYLSSSVTSAFIGVQQNCQTEAGEISTTTVTAATTSSKKVTVTPAACAAGSNVVSYTTGSCTSSVVGTCVFSSSVRDLKAYSASGSVDTAAIVVEDLDKWTV
ncbi:hypothetical protein DL96DRAFT_1549451 [Flagelloscypha sp. PMI_526]|nr:hypothetical protein DL96DRAFT_1549451 [Flagelloscypha sp. PMI_526]